MSPKTGASAHSVSVEVCLCGSCVALVTVRINVTTYGNVLPVTGIQEIPLPLSGFITQLFVVPGLIA